MIFFEVILLVVIVCYIWVRVKIILCLLFFIFLISFGKEFLIVFWIFVKGMEISIFEELGLNREILFFFVCVKIIVKLGL